MIKAVQNICMGTTMTLMCMGMCGYFVLLNLKALRPPDMEWE